MIVGKRWWGRNSARSTGADSTDVAQTLVLYHKKDELPLEVSGYRIRYLNYVKQNFA